MPRPFSRRQVIYAGALSTVAAPFVSAWAQAWPRTTIKIICGTAPGGLTDLFSRAYGEYISRAVGQPVVVENRVGATGAIAAQTVKAAAPDGHTLILSVATTFLGNRLLVRDLQYDPDKDFTLISLMPSGHLPLVVHRSTGAGNLKEFLDYAGRNEVSLGTYGLATHPHIAAHEFNKALQRPIMPVHYRGEAPMWRDLSAGVVQAASGSYLAAVSTLDSRAGRAIAVPTAQRMRKLPDVPTYAEQGLSSPAFQVKGWVGLFGPAGLPEPITQKLSELMVAAGKSEAILKMLDTFAIDEAALTRAESKKLYDEEGPIWIDLVRQLGITPT